MGLVGAWAWISRAEEDPAPQRYVEAPEEVTTFVELGGVGILTSENFVGHRIRVVEGSLRNVSDETLRSVELRVTFTNVGGDAVRESVEEALLSPLSPGSSQRYVFRYENLPPEWNYRVPEISVVRVGV